MALTDTIKAIQLDIERNFAGGLDGYIDDLYRRAAENKETNILSRVKAELSRIDQPWQEKRYQKAVAALVPSIKDSAGKSPFDVLTGNNWVASGPGFPAADWMSGSGNHYTSGAGVTPTQVAEKAGEVAQNVKEVVSSVLPDSDTLKTILLVVAGILGLGIFLRILGK